MDPETDLHGVVVRRSERVTKLHKRVLLLGARALNDKRIRWYRASRCQMVGTAFAVVYRRCGCR